MNDGWEISGDKVKPLLTIGRAFHPADQGNAAGKNHLTAYARFQ